MKRSANEIGRGVLGRARRIVRVLKKVPPSAARTSIEKALLAGVASRVLAPPRRSPEPPQNGQQKVPHFLLLCYEHNGGNPAWGDSLDKLALEGTLAATGLATWQTWYWDSDYAGFPKGDWQLLGTCRNSRPDAIILSSYNPRRRVEASVETIKILRTRWNIPIVAIWWDTCWDGFWQSIQPVLPFVDIHVVAENPLLNFLNSNSLAGSRDRFLGLWNPVVPTVFDNPGRVRDIDVSFMGQVDSYRSHRMAYIQHLIDHNVPVYRAFLGPDKGPPIRDYARILQRSKIGLSFSRSRNGHQLKGRVLEVMLCGAMLMESENPQTASLFTPMKDYVSFSSPADLLDKVRYYLEHEDERVEIAAHGEATVRRCYNHVEFWRRVIQKLDGTGGRPSSVGASASL